MNRRRLQVLLAATTWLLTGCAMTAQGGHQTAGGASAAETDIVLTLYDYARRLAVLPEDLRLREYQRLRFSGYPAACEDPLERLKEALLVSSGLLPPNAGLDHARAVWEACLAAAPGPLLAGYIRANLAMAEQAQRQQARLAALHQEIDALRQEGGTLRQRIGALESRNKTLLGQIHTLEEQINALTSIEKSLSEQGQAE
ncbi:MAG: hypothetical protein M3Z21_00410 [Pseudomonadota bacterium]|nr:hypothetical protein [Pseudomonadota bacterium]